ncbi:U3 small nucleolar RNA-associated protein 10 [Colletotrichum sp. SAR 10_70]|nr:U3 small nucleolar RNA-associated protein 10 [Colletotrichum sp. SAR 10_71]KAI8159165.1 U3 small nucleolar RNA-associated protein 10 [Colletotrichum sp. SAR 10_70]KAI8201068.1 U3 small nucleolar RNA-associated protein 10 [Colletotrichum sp. SAR 10_76]KAI8222082.1 U3 small nucleolar RNA-associated protein 10 [Colletotrichum sp. SAR 10_86]KAJ4996859.1 U3 small nucleolar RNA-associated protein 10 [Colletotrichum sp. SAR 10_66]
MASSLAAQLAQIAANSKASLDVKAQKAAHSKSLIFEPRVAATQSYHTLYTICLEGFEELCELDGRFKPFAFTLFSEQSQSEDRTQMTAAENEELDKKVESFLRLIGSRLRLMPAIRALEWLVRRFRIHEYNTRSLITTFLPYHSIPAFVTVLSILPSQIPQEYRFLSPYIKSLTCPPRSVLVHESIHKFAFLETLSEYTLEACRNLQQYPTLVSFWGGIMTEAVNGMLENMRSGRQAIQSENNQTFLTRVGRIFGEALLMKKVPNMQIASYMAVTVVAAKGTFEDAALSAFMEQIVQGWTTETVRPGLVTLCILAQYRSAKQLSAKVTKALLKVQNLGEILVELGQERRVDKMTNGLCIAFIERLCKKGDARGLPIIRVILMSQILKHKQVAVIFKSLVLAAHRLDDEVDKNGEIRKELGSTLIDLSRFSGETSEIIQTVLEEVDFDVEELEMKLDVSIRQKKALPETQDDVDMNGTNALAPTKEDLHQTIRELAVQKRTLPSCLSTSPGEVYDEFSQLFLRVVSQQSEDPTLLANFDELPSLSRQTAVSDHTYITFFVRIWSGPYPTLARAAAVDAVKKRLSDGDGNDLDFQALIPYCLIALVDSSKKVRRAAAELLIQLGQIFPPQSKAAKKSVWGGKNVYEDSAKLHWMDADAVSRLLHGVILPSIEECIMHEDHIRAILHSSLDSSAKSESGEGKKILTQANRIAILSFLASHIVATPLLRVKSNLLSILNRIKGVSSTSRTKVLLPAFKWWAALSAEETVRLCDAEEVDQSLLHTRFAEIVVPNDSDGLECLLSTMKNPESAKRPELVRSISARIRAIWNSMKADTKFDVAQTMLELSQARQVSQDDEDIIADEAADFLRNVDLTTEILSSFLESIQTGTKLITEPPPNKRRRTSSSEANRGTSAQASAELSATLRSVTFVLQLVEGSNPASHPELLDSLFGTLSELQHFRTVIGSELGYLQNLVLTSLIAMVPAYRENKSLKIDSSGGHGDLLVNCIQKSSSPIVQNSALLLIASLATAAPDLVLHSVMPIFTFMGASVLRQNDDYSAHVVNQTIREVVPPLMTSLKKGKRNPVAGATELLASFVTAYEHIPAHRKQGLFIALVNTLGPDEFLYALLAMLVDRYGPSDSLMAFASELLGVYSAEVQLQTLAKLLDLISDIFKPKPGLSATLLGIGEDMSEKKPEATALQQLTVFPALLSSRKLRKEVGILTEKDDMDASKIRELYAILLRDVLALAETVKQQKPLHECCGNALANLLNLLSIGEFIKSVETLLDRTEIDLRRKVLRALEVRVDQENVANVTSRTALLAFLPQLTAAIRDTDDIKYKHTAVACVDKIAEKYGKKDVEAVAAAAQTIAGVHCLGQPDIRLRVMALLCLASLVDVLQDGILPVLSLAVPQAILYIQQSVELDEPATELHNASYSFITALAQHLPYMISGKYLDNILLASNKSAEADVDDEADDERLNCLRFLARKVDAKVMLASLEKNWIPATEAGYNATDEWVDIFSVIVESHTKSVVTKNVTTLSTILLSALDLRRREQATGKLTSATSQRVANIEASINDVALSIIYKLNDAAFRPIFAQMVEWSTQLPKQDITGRVLRRFSVYGFFLRFFESLKSIVTSYATYIVDDAVEIVKSCDLTVPEQKGLWQRVLSTMARCFEHDQDDFWQAPAHFGKVAPVLVDQFLHASSVDLTAELIPAVVELAAAADSQDHQKELNSSILRHLRSEQAAVRLAAVKCQQELVVKLGEELLPALPEMLPYISELQDDDDEVVERETHRWIHKIEGVLGESLDSMLQ